MAERVPLTDEQRDVQAGLRNLWHEMASKGIERGVDYPSIVLSLLKWLDAAEAELRSSRALEQELQQRIDRLLATCEAADTDLTPRLLYVELLDPRNVRAALTETGDPH